MTQKIRVIVADGDDAARAGIVCSLASARDIDVLGHASDTQALVALLDAHACDAVIADLALPGCAGSDNAVPFLRRLLRRRAHPHVIALTGTEHCHVFVGLRQMGVTGIVDRRDAADALLDAIATVCGGGAYLSTRVRDAFTEQQRMQPATVGPLSAREWEVFQLRAQGLEVREIAHRLKRSGKTVSTQKRSAMRKLGLKTEADLVSYALEVGLI